MTLKIILLVLTACFFQEIVSESNNEVNMVDIPFEELEGIDSFAEYITLKYFEIYLKSNRKLNAAKCYNQDSYKYVSLVEQFVRNLNAAIKKFLKSPSERNKFYKNLEEPLVFIIKTMKKCPDHLKSLLKEKKFTETLKYLKELRQRIEEYQIDFFAELKQIKERDSKYDSSLENYFKKIRLEAKNESKRFVVDLQKCAKANILWDYGLE